MTRATTTRTALDRAELGSTAIAVVLSTTGYLSGGPAYLSRGVVGDLLGLAVLAAVLLVRRARLRHEALLCLLLIGAVLLVAPQWPLQVAEPVWWVVFTVGLTGYLLVRHVVLVRLR